MARPSIVNSAQRRAVSVALKRYLEITDKSIASLARELRISRQSLHDYRDEIRTPSLEQLGKLVNLPEFDLRIGGKRQTPDNFPRSPTPSPREPVQEEIPFVLPVTLESEARDLKVGIKRKPGGALELTVRIKLVK